MSAKDLIILEVIKYISIYSSISMELEMDRNRLSHEPINPNEADTYIGYIKNYEKHFKLNID